MKAKAKSVLHVLAGRARQVWHRPSFGMRECPRVCSAGPPFCCGFRRKEWFLPLRLSSQRAVIALRTEDLWLVRCFQVRVIRAQVEIGRSDKTNAFEEIGGSILEPAPCLMSKLQGRQSNSGNCLRWRELHCPSDQDLQRATHFS